MNKRLLMFSWLAVMLIMPTLQGFVSPTTIQNEFVLELEDPEIAQASGYSGAIPMNLSVMVGDSGNELTNAFNYLAAVPFAVRSNSTHTASGLILPDDIEDYASPLDDWLELLGGSMNELVFIGDVQNTEHQALTDIADSHVVISGADHFEVAANLAQEFFGGTSSVVLVEAPGVNQFSQSSIIANTTATLNPMSSRTVSGRTSSSTDWEYFGSFTPSGGGAIITRTSGGSYIYFELLAAVSGSYYPVDYPYYDGQTVMYPYDEATSLYLHAIDLYDYDRSVNLNFDIDVPDADFYPFVIESGEDCRIDFDLSVVGDLPCDIGLNVLDPSGNIILTGNRFALFEDVNEVSEISISLSHPSPGQYRAYVFSAEHSSVSYDLSITKQVVDDDYIAAGVNAANGASVASLLGAPLLYTHKGSLDTVTHQALEALGPNSVYYVNPTGEVDSNLELALSTMGFSVITFENFTEVQSILAELGGRNSNEGSVVLYDSLGTNFVAAGLSAAQRRCPALPFSYDDSELMTLSQIPEQINWLREYQLPLSASISFVDLWTSSADFTEINPPISSMTNIAYRFFAWLFSEVGISIVDDVITVAPFYGPGETLPPSFERALTGRADTGRYSSIDTDATLVQLIRSILRVPLMSVPSHSQEALGTYLVYSYGDQVMNNNRVYRTIDNSNDFSSLITSSGLSPVMQAGPSTISELNTAPYVWITTFHGGIGYDLYEYDGRVMLFYTDSWRGYDSGRSSSSPDASTDESPQHIVNPPEGYMNIYNMSQLVTGTNLRGMFALLDSCQLGSSYGPSTLMEHGADAVVACRADTLVGPADMLEYNILDSMVNNHYTIGDALDYSFHINSHRYATYDLGLDSYVSSSDAAIVGASSLQFIVFGDPDVTLYDWDVIPFPVMDRCVGVGPTRVAYAHPGSTYFLPMGMHDPLGNIYAKEGSYYVSVFDSEHNLLSGGMAICTSFEMGTFQIEFASNAPLGTYDVEITDTSTDSTFHCQVVLEWPLLVIELVESSSYAELGMWDIEITVWNPQDVIADTIVQVSLNGDVLLLSDASWLPGHSTNDFKMMVMFGHSGSETLSVLITIGSQSYQCCSNDSLVLVTGHWVTPVLWYIIPALGVCVVMSGVYTRTKGSKTVALQKGLDAEINGDYDTSFKVYCKYRMSRAATRVAVKENLPEEMMQSLMNRFGREIYNDLQTIANRSAMIGEFATASRIYMHLGQSEKALQYKAIAELEDGLIEDATQTFHDLLSASISGYAVNVISHIKTMNETVQSKFINEAQDAILNLSSRLKTDAPSQSMLLALIQNHIDDNEYLIEFFLTSGRIDLAADRILSLKTIPKMIKLTKTLDDEPRNRVAVAVLKFLIQTHKPKQIEKYITSVGLTDNSVIEAVRPLVEQLVTRPQDKELLDALHSISKSSNTGSIAIVDDAVDAIKQLISAAKKLGVSAENLSSISMIPVIAGMKDQPLAGKILEQVEKQVLSGSVPASADLDALAEYVYSLRASLLSLDESLPAIRLRLQSCAKTLENRLSNKIQETLAQCTLNLGKDDWLEASSKAVADQIVSSIPLNDMISSVRACIIARGSMSSYVVDQCLQNSIGVEKQVELANLMMENPAVRDRLLRRHLRMQMNEHGSPVWVPDIQAAFEEAMGQVTVEYRPQVTSALRLGSMKAARLISNQAMEAQIPTRELFELSVVYLGNSREKESVYEYIQSIEKYFTREELVSIIEEAKMPSSTLDDALSQKL